MAHDLAEAQLEVNKIRLNQIGYRPTKAHMENLARALDQLLQALHEKEQ